MFPRPLPHCAAAALLALGLSTCGGETAAASRPDVIFVVVDTLRADHMSLYGYERATTPNLERLAEDAVVFDHALAGSSWTVPSMAMLFTGTYLAASVRTLDGELASFPEAFQRAGYRTGGIVSNPLLGRVKMHSKEGQPPVIYESGFERGFDEFDVYRHSVGQEEAVYGQANGWTADEVVQRGTDWVESTDACDQPYLLYLHLFDPHFPRLPEDPERFDAGSYGEPFAALDAAKAAGREAELDELRGWAAGELSLYDSEIAQVDDALAGLFAWLEERGTLDDTVVVLTADHGEGLWERPMPQGERPKPHNRMPALYSDHGIQLYDEQVRVPLVVWSPLLEPQRVSGSVSLLDVAPSLHYLANLPAPEDAEGPRGVNLFDSHADRTSIFSVTTRGTSITEDGRWRLHLPAEHLTDRFGAMPELYDLSVDPGEAEPVDDLERTLELVERVRAMKSFLDRKPELSGEEARLRRELLDSLGYIDQ